MEREGVEGEKKEEDEDTKKADCEEEEEDEEGWWVGEMASKTLEEEAQERNITDLFDPDLLGKNFHQHPLWRFLWGQAREGGIFPHP